ncbi:MAG: hypothetical protein J5933_02070 [Clostridia bacterium]|nr:hypothetical protein [Clostridia bacterium]
MNKLKILCIMLAAIMCTFAFSCGGGQQPSGDTTSELPDTADSGNGQTEQLPELTDEEIRDRDDEAFLAGISFPRYALGEEGKAFFSGRWYEKEIDGVNHMVTTTDGAQLFLLTEGTEKLVLSFTSIDRRGTPYIAVSVDGSDPERVLITEAEIELPDKERHAVRIFADGLHEMESKWIEEIGFALRSIDVDEGGRFRGIVPQNKLVFFYGDSITEGIAILGNGKSSDFNSATAAFPYQCCQELGAIPYYIGYSASGLLSHGYFRSMKIAMEKLSLKRDIDYSLIPDLIVINHGCNDGGTPSEEFCTAMEETLTRLIEMYPGVPIAYMIPIKGALADEIIKTAEKFDIVSVIETKDWELTTFTDGVHPDVECSKKIGSYLAEALRNLYGSDFFE